jgi:hypothetical protein
MANSNPASGVIELLPTATTRPTKLPETINALETTVWNTEGWAAGLSEASAEAPRDLAYDLDYYEADPDSRAEEPSYFGEERATGEIRSALARVTQSDKAG